jgi:hypothetical protein
MRHKCIVKYQIATYSGEETVFCDPIDENDVIIAKCKKQLTRKAGGSLPFGCETYKIIERTEAEF